MGCQDDPGCRETLEQIYEYLDGELDPTHLAAVRGHLEQCPYCSQQLGYEREVRSMIVRSCTCLHAPDELRNKIMSTIAQLHVSATFFSGGFGATASFLASDPRSDR